MRFLFETCVPPSFREKHYSIHHSLFPEQQQGEALMIVAPCNGQMERA